MNIDIDTYIDSISNTITLRPSKLSGHLKSVTKVIFSNNLLFSSSKDFNIIVWDIQKKEEIAKLSHDGGIYDITIDDKSNILFSCSSDENIKIWDINNFSLITTIELDSGIRSVSVLNNLLCCSVDDSYGDPNKLLLYDISDIKNPKLIKEYEHNSRIDTIVINKFNENIYFGTNSGEVCIFDTKINDIQKRKYIVSNYKVSKIKFDKTDKILLVCGTDNIGYLLDFKLSLIRKYNLNFPVLDGLFFKDDYIILCGGIDVQSVANSYEGKFSIMFFSKILKEEMGNYSLHFGPVNSLAINSDQTYLASAASDGYVILYELLHT